MALAIPLNARTHFGFSVAAALRATFLPASDHATQRLAHRLPIIDRLRQRLRLKTILPAVFVPTPILLDSLWDGLLKAVPKKKTSHMKKRHRQMAGKALKDVTALSKCSACGRTKRSHILCPYCVQSIKQWLGNGFKTKEQVATQKRAEAEKLNAELEAIGRKPYPLPPLDEKGPQ